MILIPIFAPPTGTSLTTTGETTCFTAQNTYNNIGSILCVNKTASAVVITVKWYDASNTTAFHLVYQYPIPANGSINVAPEAFSLDKSDEIRVTAGTANAVDVTVCPVQVAGRSL